LIAALQILADEERNAREMQRLSDLLEPIAKRLSSVAGVAINRGQKPVGGFPVLEFHIDANRLGRTAVEVVSRLQTGEPPIYVFAPLVAQGEFVVNPASLTEEHGRIIAERLYVAATGK